MTFTVSYGESKMASNSQAQACSLCGQDWKAMGFSDGWRGRRRVSFLKNCYCLMLFVSVTTFYYITAYLST